MGFWHCCVGECSLLTSICFLIFMWIIFHHVPQLPSTQCTVIFLSIEKVKRGIQAGIQSQRSLEPGNQFQGLCHLWQGFMDLCRSGVCMTLNWPHKIKSCWFWHVFVIQSVLSPKMTQSSVISTIFCYLTYYQLCQTLLQV